MKIWTMLRPPLALLAIFSVALGGVYPLAVTCVAQLLFPAAAEGSLISNAKGEVIGSKLLAQPFVSQDYFWPRPSATTPAYNPAYSTASNLGAGNPELAKQVEERIAALRKADPKQTEPVPAELVEASGSGLDPDISPKAAQYQAARVARARGLKVDEVRALIEHHTQHRQWGLFGQKRVNVLALNRALDEAEEHADTK